MTYDQFRQQPDELLDDWIKRVSRLQTVNCRCGGTHVVETDAAGLSCHCPHCGQRHHAPRVTDWGSGNKQGLGYADYRKGAPAEPVYEHLDRDWAPCLEG